MAFREMLIKIDSPEHSEAVQKRLFELGYKWVWTKRGQKSFANTFAKALRCGDDGVIKYASSEFYSKEYPHLPWVDILAEENGPSIEKPPIGLTPEFIWKSNVVQARVAEIVEAVQRYKKEEKSVPVEWIDELKKLVC